jgi:hypothetical protein
MQICLLALWSDSLTYTMASAMAHSGHEVLVWVADMDRDRQSIWSLSRRIAAIPGASVIADATVEPPDHIDQLIVQSHPLLLHHREVLDRLASKSVRLTAVSSGDRSRPYRQALKLQWRERRWYGHWFRKLTRVVYKDGYYPVDLLGLFKPRRVVGFDAHSHFLENQALFQAIHAADWDAGVLRPIRANFLGSRDPDVRGRILDSVEDFFTQASQSNHGSHKRMVWHAFTDTQHTSALSPEEFLKVLSESDFTLAPPGYSLVTHRPVEALLRGSIPVLNEAELDLYDLGLADGVNCIAVRPGDWPAVMARITRMDEAEVIGMRRNIQSMLTGRVAYPSLARDISRRLGLDV